MAGPGPAPRPAGYPARRFFGLLLMTAGGLIAGLSGLCSAAVLVTMVVNLAASGGGGGGLMGFFNTVGVILVFGGVPFGIGGGLFILGRNLSRADEPPPPSVAKTFE